MGEALRDTSNNTSHYLVEESVGLDDDWLSVQSSIPQA